MKVFKLMNNLMKKHIPIVLLSLLMGLFTILSNIGMLSSSSVLISRAALHPDVLDLMVLIVAVRFFGIARGVFRYLERIISHNTTFKLLSSLRKWFYKSFNESYSENHKYFNTGTIYTKLVTDIDTLKEFFLRVLYPFVTASLTGLITTIFISFFSKAASAVYVLAYITTGFVIPIILFLFSAKLSEQESRLKKEINLVLLDFLKGAVEVSIYSLKKTLLLKYNSLRHELSLIQKRKNIITSLGDNLYGISVSVLIGITLYLTAPLVSDGTLSGIYYAMVPLAMMASFEALLPMPSILGKYKEASVAVRNLLAVLQEASQNNSPAAKAVNSCELSVINLSVAGESPKEPIIKNISFYLPQGKKLALVGTSGSGKSTLIKALLGFMDFSDGDIKLGNASYKDLSLEDIRKQFSYVDQEPYMFSTSIRENLMLADPKADRETLLKALDSSQISAFINSLPQGINTKLGEFGSNISGGEKQRLSLARAFLKDSPILLLDEPTASLDIELEKKLISSIHDYIGHKSCIWVTHRLVSMEKMDEIIVMDNGEIAERGTHKELILKRGHYYKLWAAQNQHIIL